jgi:hypothetical protein
VVKGCGEVDCAPAAGVGALRAAGSPAVAVGDGLSVAIYFQQVNISIFGAIVVSFSEAVLDGVPSLQDCSDTNRE